jgi:hypothetical protein
VPKAAAGSITYEWVKPDTPDVVRRRIIRLSFELENLIEPMTVAGELARIDIQERFTELNDPDGQPWQAWSPTYLPWVLNHTTGPVSGVSANLQLSGATRDAIGSRSAFVPTNEGLFIDTSGIPEWGMWNNFGASRSVAAEGQTAAEWKSLNLAFRETEDVLPGARLPGENPLPRRAFLGLTDKVQFEMDLAFYRWFDGEVAFATSTLGKPFFRHSKRAGVGRFPGRFAPRDD